MTPQHAIVEVEATNVEVQPRAILAAVELTVTNAAGDGFRTFLDPAAALDLSLRLLGACMRLRGLVP